MQKKYGRPDGVEYEKIQEQKTVVKGIEFDSKMEADYYRYLLGKLQAGEILQIELQPKIMLQPGFKVAGQTVRAITYTPPKNIAIAAGLITSSLTGYAGEPERKT